MYYEMIGFVPEQGDPPSSDVPPFSPAESALFLDFDGALVEIAETPDAIHVPEKLEDAAERAGSMPATAPPALVSGRSVAALRKSCRGSRVC
jgi:trehalose 6-phosphate phosphatase